MGGKVYDVLGELFEGHALRDLLVQAIRYGDTPEIRGAIFRQVEGAVDVEAIQKLAAERKLTSEGLNPVAVAEIRKTMERAAARRLQPHFIGSFFREAFVMLGGRISERERGRFEITRVPGILKERDRLIGRADPVLDRYARVTFDKSLIPAKPQAELLAPGHPLLDSLVDIVLERFQPLLTQGAVLVDESDQGTDPSLLIYLEHAVRDGRAARSGEPRVISQRLQFVALREDGTAIEAGPAPYLDYRPIDTAERAKLSDVITAPWLSGQIESKAMAHAIAHLVPQHLNEVKSRRLPEVDKVEREVRARLIRERDYWDARAARLREEERAGRVNQRLNAHNAEAIAEKMVERLHKRQDELARERQIAALPPQLKGAALVIPAGLLVQRFGATAALSNEFSEDPAARAEVERRAMEAIFAAERRLGHDPRDVSAEKKGWDIESRDHRTGHLRFIEVKGRHEDADTVILTKNEVLAALNAPDAFILAIVRVAKAYTHEPVYIRRPPFREPGFAESHVALKVADLLGIGSAPC